MSGRKNGTGVNAGVSSILIIFVLLCLTTLATLSVVSANTDYKLTAKSAQAESEYYAADARAEELLAFVDDCLLKAYEKTNDEDGYKREIQNLISQSPVPMDFTGDMLYYSVPVNESQQLQVALGLPYPAGADARRFTREQWRVVITAEWQTGDETLNLWGGEDDMIIFGG